MALTPKVLRIRSTVFAVATDPVNNDRKDTVCISQMATSKTAIRIFFNVVLKVKIKSFDFRVQGDAKRKKKSCRILRQRASTTLHCRSRDAQKSHIPKSFGGILEIGNSRAV